VKLEKLVRFSPEWLVVAELTERWPAPQRECSIKCVQRALWPTRRFGLRHQLSESHVVHMTWINIKAVARRSTQKDAIKTNLCESGPQSLHRNSDTGRGTLAGRSSELGCHERNLGVKEQPPNDST
jgi:hypothetical protein